MYKITFKIILILGIGLFSSVAPAQTSLFEHPDFETIAKDHKIIAIVPFDASVKLRPKEMKQLPPGQLEEMQKSEGLAIQSSMYSRFLKRKKRGKLLINVQDPNKTIALLSQNGYTKLTDYTPEQLAQILGVDAVITGRFETDKPMSEGASIALGVLVGFWGATNAATINMSVYNAADGELLRDYNKRVRGSLGSGTGDLIN